MASPDLVSVSIDIASFIVVMGIAVYGMRLIFIMRKGSLEKSWRYAALGSIFFALGISLFVVDSIFPGQNNTRPLFDIGGAVMLIGGIMLLQSFRIQYKIFEVKISLQRPNESIKDLA